MNNTSRLAIRDLDRLFGGFYQPTTATENVKAFSPKVDVYEQDTDYQLIAELPGFNKDSISITVEESTLTISAEVNYEQDASQGKLLRKERQSGKFSRSFKLGKDIELADIKASFKDGLLTLTVPKIVEAVVEPRKIEIH